MIKVSFGRALVIFWGISVSAFWIFAVIPEKDWEPRIRHLKKLSADTTFAAERIEPEYLPIQSTGRLGAFYSCLTKYGGLGSRRMTRPNNGIEEWVVLKLQDNTRLDIRINNGEAFFFSLKLYDKNNTLQAGSDLYAINCDMELLNKSDSDMHCEDKVLGNEIRPVCTYRPQQPPSQDDAKG